MKTVKDVIEMLRANARGERCDDFSFTSLANLLEEVYKPEDPKCNQFKLRKALEECVGEYPSDKEARAAWVRGKFALKAPPRNCDLYANAQEAWEAMYDDRGFVKDPIEERRLTIDWLFAEAKKDSNTEVKEDSNGTD